VADEFKRWKTLRASAVSKKLVEQAIARRQSQVPKGVRASDVDSSTFARAVDEGAEALARRLFALQTRAIRAEWLEDLTGFEPSPLRLRVAAALERLGTRRAGK
jgi:hypothetical protein